MMFGLLKKKLSEWSKKLAHEEEEKEEVAEAPKEKIEEEKIAVEKPGKVEEIQDKEIEKKIEEVKEEIQEVKAEVLKEKKGFFERIKEKFEKKEEKASESVEEFKGIPEEVEERGFLVKVKEKVQRVEISGEEFNERFDELETILLENNVAIEVVERIKNELKKRLVGKKILRKEMEHEVRDSLADALHKIILQPFDIVEQIRKRDPEKPYIILFFGINGTGKTTTIAKLANFLQKSKISCVLAAADTFRAASIEQLEHHANALHIPIVKHSYGADPAAVGFDAVKYARAHSKDCVLIDTAGRMHTKVNLLKEMEKIVRVTNPDLKIFIAEAITGNDAVQQAKQFQETAGIDASIITKADIDEKGGTILSISYITQRPILFLGIGQEYGDLEAFNKDKCIERLGL